MSTPVCKVSVSCLSISAYWEKIINPSHIELFLKACFVMEVGKTESWAVVHSLIRYQKFGPMKALDQCNLKRSNPENFFKKVTWTSFTNQVHFSRFIRTYGSTSYHFRKFKKSTGLISSMSSHRGSKEKEKQLWKRAMFQQIVFSIRES